MQRPTCGLCILVHMYVHVQYKEMTGKLEYVCTSRCISYFSRKDFDFDETQTTHKTQDFQDPAASLERVPDMKRAVKVSLVQLTIVQTSRWSRAYCGRCDSPRKATNEQKA